MIFRRHADSDSRINAELNELHGARNNQFASARFDRHLRLH